MLGGIPKETGVPSGTAEIIFLDSISCQQFLEFIGKHEERQNQNFTAEVAAISILSERIGVATTLDDSPLDFGWDFDELQSVAESFTTAHHGF
jgi:hypothetical protein